MKRSMLYLALFLTVSSSLAYAQTAAVNENACRRFKMRVQTPPAELDNQMVIPEDNRQVRALGKVIDPCASSRNMPVRNLGKPPKQFQFQPVKPALPFMPAPPAPLKTPAEIFRELRKPKTETNPSQQ